MSDKQEIATVEVETIDARKAANEATAAMEAGANGKPKRPATRTTVPNLGPKVAGGLTEDQIKAGQASVKASKAKVDPSGNPVTKRDKKGLPVVGTVKGSESPAKASKRKNGDPVNPEPKASEPAPEESKPASEPGTGLAILEPASEPEGEPLTIGSFLARVEGGPEIIGDVLEYIPTNHPIGPLSEAERARKAHLESVITQGVAAYHATGESLMAIRIEGLYRDEGSFGDYIKARPEWGFSARHAHYVINATEVRKQLIAAGETELPETESAARPLSTVPIEDRPEVWKAAKDEARKEGVAKPQRKHVEAAAVKSGKSSIGSKGGSKTPSADSRKRVQKAVDSGVISEGTEIKSEVINEGEAPADAPISDDAWLDTLNPIRDRLTVDTRKGYDFDALAYRKVEVERIAFLEKSIVPLVKKAEKTLKDVPPYIGRIWWSLKTNHPLQWKVCDSCNGTGHINKSACTDCRRRGYHV